MSCRRKKGPSDSELADIRTVSVRTARRHGASIHEADDVAQNTVIKFLTNWERDHIVAARARPDPGWFNYVSRTARNVHLDLVRANARRIARERKIAGFVGEQLNDRPAVQRAQPTDASATEAFLARQAVLDLAESLESPQQRTCVRLRFAEGYTVREIAAELDVETQTVHFHLRNAKRILRSQLAGADQTSTF